MIGRRAFRDLAVAGRTVVAVALLASCGGGGGGGGEVVAPQVAPTVSVSAGASTLASGSTLPLLVRVTDTRGAVVTTPAVAWTSSDGQVATVSSNGVVTGGRVGTATITASSLGVSGSVTLAITPGLPAQLVVRQAVTTATAGETFSSPVVVDVQDAAGNTTNAINRISLALNGGGTLRGTVAANATNGSASFADLAIDGPIGSRTLTASSAGLTPATSATIQVVAGRPASLSISTPPGIAAAGQPLGTQPIIELRDAFGNRSGSNATVSVALSGGGALSGTTSVVASAGIAAFTTLTVSGTVGPRTLTFTSAGVPPVTSAEFVLNPGPPAALAVTRAPAGGGLNGPFTTQPQLEVRDGSGNLAPSAAVVTASIVSGGGTLTAPTATAVNGVVSFSGLGITGGAGARDLRFSAGALTPATTTVSPCDAARGPRLATAAPPRALLSNRGGLPAGDTLLIVDEVGSCTAIASVSNSVTYTSGAGWLTSTILFNPLRVALTAFPGQLAVGEYRATSTVSSPGSNILSLPVVFTVQPAVLVTYGTATERVRELDIGGSFRTVATARNELNLDVSNTVSYVSRAPSVARVGADGTVTAVGAGPAWLVAFEPRGSADSIFVNVRRASGPVLRLDLANYSTSPGATFSVNVVLDTRGAALGAGQILLNWPTSSITPGTLVLVSSAPGTTGSPVITSDIEAGTSRIAFASTTGVTGAVVLARLDFRAQNRGASQFVLRVVDLLDPVGASLAGATTSFTYPWIVR